MRSVYRIPVSIGLLAIGILCTAAPASADVDLSAPNGDVMLTIAGNIQKTNAGGEAKFDLEMLHALGYRTLRTSTPWTDGTHEFGGVLMKDLLDAVGAEGKTVVAETLNNKGYRIDISDFLNYPVLLATSVDGERLRIRDKGPLWIVYPRDEFTELWQRPAERKTMWHITRLSVE